MVACLVPLARLILLRRNYSLGLKGERAVAEELNKLMAEGCQIFHDYPGGPKWNIDHTVVAPSGVYAVETKMRRKKRASGKKKDYEVVFDGQRLRFPLGSSECGLDQARRNARDLSKVLCNSSAERADVQAILTFPGWWVTRTGKSDVIVVNPKEIRGVIVNAATKLSSVQMKQVAFQIEQKCRDVEI
jgi:hypothetical protein